MANQNVFEWVKVNRHLQSVGTATGDVSSLILEAHEYEKGSQAEEAEPLMHWIVAQVRDVNRIAAARNIWNALGVSLPDAASYPEFILFDGEGPCVYVPRIERPRKRHERFLLDEAPRYVNIMPGYLFVHCEASAHAWEACRYATGVSGLLGYGEGSEKAPDRIPDDWIWDMRLRELAGEWNELRAMVERIRQKERDRQNRRKRRLRGLDSLGEVMAEIVG